MHVTDVENLPHTQWEMRSLLSLNICNIQTSILRVKHMQYISVYVLHKDETLMLILIWSTMKTKKIKYKKKVVQTNKQVWSININSWNYLLIGWLVDHWCPSTGVGSHFVGVEFLVFCHHFLFPQRVLTQNLFIVLSQ